MNKINKRFIAQCGDESDIFTTKEKAQDFFLNCPEDGCEISHVIKKVYYSIECEDCGCETELLDENFEPIDEPPTHFKNCKQLLPYEPDNQN